jgi:transposase-like protein
MPKESTIARSSPRQTHRTYTREFKAELVAACQQPGVSIAGLGSSHGMNANVLHRWLKEHARDGRHQLDGVRLPGAVVASQIVQTGEHLSLNFRDGVSEIQYREKTRICASMRVIFYRHKYRQKPPLGIRSTKNRDNLSVEKLDTKQALSDV